MIIIQIKAIKTGCPIIETEKSRVCTVEDDV
jgi:hypothetical protein